MYVRMPGPFNVFIPQRDEEGQGGKPTYVNIIPQYRVECKAYEYPKISRGITVKEFLKAINWVIPVKLPGRNERLFNLQFPDRTGLKIKRDKTEDFQVCFNSW
jgi:hypothetical protein